MKTVSLLIQQEKLPRVGIKYLFTLPQALYDIFTGEQ